ncbi:methyltransferase domain-containing protein [Edaphobacter albus]|uniref:methyltransferase domain-containing protein n=1 Tax=Edaphobacter sp. 4G125 TaxID=2763071 RepID=UPI001645BBCE|nr:methyltransferase domain-containing protein [Edaphobacter sp. 4G125]QNI37656.1 methyltransferase domain-containing protein [Edaphobacter sp. 4G125]
MSNTATDREEFTDSNLYAFDAWARVYDQQANPLIELEKRFLSCVIPDIDGKDILDVGCGTGRWLERLVRFGSARSVCGVDNSSEMLAVARRKHLDNTLLLKANLPHLPINTASIDFALASFVLSYIPEIGFFAQELTRTLRRSGELFLTDMHPETAIELGWKRGFHSSQGPVRLDARPHSLASIITAMADHGLRLASLYEPSFGEPERCIFRSKGKEAEYRRAAGRPAIYILHFIRESVESGAPELILSDARCVLGPQESVVADIAIRRDEITINTAKPLDTACDEIDLSGYSLFPGLINAHDHLEFALFPRLGDPPYKNATEWALEIQRRYSREIDLHKQVPKDVRLWWGGLRNILCGVTTVCHHNPLHPVFDDHRFPINVVKGFGWEHSLRFATNLEGAHRQSTISQPFILHACEGIDSAAVNEFEELEALRLVDERLVLVHGTALTPLNTQRLNQQGASLIICPSSNDYLFSRFPSLQQLLSVERLAIGSDSSLTATGDLLDEIGFCHEQIGLSAQTIYDSVTRLPARILRLKSGQGRIGPHSPADLFAVRTTALDPATLLSSISWRDVELVMVRGVVRLASPEILPRLPYKSRWNLACISIDGLSRWIDAPLRDLFTSAAEVLGVSNLFLNGRRLSMSEV